MRFISPAASSSETTFICCAAVHASRSAHRKRQSDTESEEVSIAQELVYDSGMAAKAMVIMSLAGGVGLGAGGDFINVTPDPRPLRRL